MKQDMILILDLGSDKNTQIAREIRALGVYTEIHAHDLSAAELAALPNVKGILLNGGPNRIVNGAAIDASQAVYAFGCPILAADHKGAPALPEDADYLSMSGLRIEARQKLDRQRPRSLGQASRIPGVSPGDVSVLMIWLRTRKA